MTTVPHTPPQPVTTADVWRAFSRRDQHDGTSLACFLFPDHPLTTKSQRSAEQALRAMEDAGLLWRDRYGWWRVFKLAQRT